MNSRTWTATRVQHVYSSTKSHTSSLTLCHAGIITASSQGSVHLTGVLAARVKQRIATVKDCWYRCSCPSQAHWCLPSRQQTLRAAAAAAAQGAQAAAAPVSRRSSHSQTRDSGLLSGSGSTLGLVEASAHTWYHYWLWHTIAAHAVWLLNNCTFLRKLNFQNYILESCLSETSLEHWSATVLHCFRPLLSHCGSANFTHTCSVAKSQPVLWRHLAEF